MAENSKIEWTHHTFNPWMGCTKVAPGCAHCYAESLMDTRWGKVQWGPNGTRVLASPESWKNPLKWNRDAEKAGERRRVFCASLADVFEDWQSEMRNSHGNVVHRCQKCGDTFGVSSGVHANGVDCACGGIAKPLFMDDVRRDLFKLIDATPYLDWLILTKRPENIRRMWPERIPDGRLADGIVPASQRLFRGNVQLLTSVSEQESANKNIPELLKCRDLVPVLGVSAEPLLGPIDFRLHSVLLGNRGGRGSIDGEMVEFAGIDWIIVGGESGHGARPCNFSWIEDIANQCRRADVSVFVKQLGANAIDDLPKVGFRKPNHGIDKTPIVLKDKKGGDWNEWPDSLRVRQYPTPTGA